MTYRSHRNTHRNAFALGCLAALLVVGCDDPVRPPERGAPRPSLIATVPPGATPTGPIPTGPIPTWAVPLISAGVGQTCGRKTDGTIVCWGASPTDYGEATPPTGLAGVVDLTTASGFSCALKSDATVVCWGTTVDPVQGSITPPAGLSSVVQISSGFHLACALKSDGTVVCWGLDAAGGYDVYGWTTPPTGLSGVVQVSAGYPDVCALKSDGTVVCWGSSYPVGPAVPPPGLSGVVQLTSGELYTCALKSDGTVVCWGNPPYGGATPPVGLSGVVQIDAHSDGHHTCALKNDGTVTCWGANYPTGLDAAAIPPSGLSGVTQVSAGAGFTCAVKSDGAVVCWGHDGGRFAPAGYNLDVTPPSIKAPSSVTVNATSPAGATVTYAASAADNLKVTSFSCTPASGTVFAIGLTTVSCTAADAAGNSASASFAVNVKGAEAQLTNLLAIVQALNLPRATAANLVLEINTALEQLRVRQTRGTWGTCGTLQLMLSEIAAQSGSTIPAGNAAMLIAEITRIRAVIGC